MTDDVPIKKWAGIQMNQDFINVKSRSGYSMTFADTDQKNEYLPHDVSNQKLGLHIREALSLSRFVHPVEQKELDLYLYNPDRYKEWLELTMKRFGYKTKGRMFKPMSLCHVDIYQGLITMRPMHQCGLDGWDRTGLIDTDNVIIPESCTDEELGAAARLALSRCTSRWA